MAASVLAHAVIEIGANWSSLKKAMFTISDHLSGVSTNAAAAKSSIFLLGRTVIAAGIAFAAAGAAVYKVSSLASELQKEIDLTVQTFGRMSSIIYKTADVMQAKWGLVRQEVLAVTTAFGEMFNKIGLGGKTGAEMSAQLAQLARDLASNRGISFGEAAGQIQGALGGSGKFFDEARVEARAFQMGLMRLHQPMSDTARAYVRQILLMESLAYVEGEAALRGQRLSDEFAELGGHFKRIGTFLGSIALPTFTLFMNIVNFTIGRIADFADQLSLATSEAYKWYKGLFGGNTDEMDEQIRQDEITRFRNEEQARIQQDLAIAQAMHTTPRMAVHSGFEEFRKRLLEGASGGRFALQKQLVDLAREQRDRLDKIAANTARGGAPGPQPQNPAIAVPY